MGQYKDFSDELKRSIATLLDEKVSNEKKNYAVFDADGTLWDFDLGEVFFQYQIDNELVSIPKNPWDYYHTIKNDSPEQAYLWLAQINEGCHLKHVRQWASDCVKNFGDIPFFPAVQDLIRDLQKRQVEIFVVTASIKWAVEPGAALLGIPEDHVIGVQTAIDNGLITSQQKGPITYRQGKAKALFYETQGEAPILAAGNTLGDQHIIESSSGVRLCLHSAQEGSKLYNAEMELQNLAQQNQWLRHTFY